MGWKEWPAWVKGGIIADLILDLPERAFPKESYSNTMKPNF